MPDPAERALYFQNRAEECLRVAELAWSDEVRDRYRAIAGAYKVHLQLSLAKPPDILAAAARSCSFPWSIGWADNC